MSDGLLSIDLVREIPEAMRPRKIELGGGDRQSIEAEAKRPREDAAMPMDEPERERTNA
jgi:molecular chaperone IbpA